MLKLALAEAELLDARRTWLLAKVEFSMYAMPCPKLAPVPDVAAWPVMCRTPPLTALHVNTFGIATRGTTGKTPEKCWCKTLFLQRCLLDSPNLHVPCTSVEWQLLH